MQNSNVPRTLETFRDVVDVLRSVVVEKTGKIKEISLQTNLHTYLSKALGSDQAFSRECVAELRNRFGLTIVGQAPLLERIDQLIEDEEGLELALPKSITAVSQTQEPKNERIAAAVNELDLPIVKVLKSDQMAILADKLAAFACEQFTKEQNEKNRKFLAAAQTVIEYFVDEPAESAPATSVTPISLPTPEPAAAPEPTSAPKPSEPISDKDMLTVGALIQRVTALEKKLEVTPEAKVDTRLDELSKAVEHYKLCAETIMAEFDATTKKFSDQDTRIDGAVDGLAELLKPLEQDIEDLKTAPTSVGEIQKDVSEKHTALNKKLIELRASVEALVERTTAAEERTGRVVTVIEYIFHRYKELGSTSKALKGVRL